MVVVRFLAVVLVVSGLMLLGADVVTTLETGEPKLRSLESIWALLDAGSVEALKAWAQTSLPAPLPEGVATLFAWPAFAVLGALGVILAVLFRQRDDVYD
jgi:hypothetical protein